MNVIEISKNEVRAIIESIPKSAFFTVEFIKKGDKYRKMNCRRGVVSRLNPNPSRPAPVSKDNFVTVFDLKAENGKGGYRKFNLDTTFSIVTDHKKYVVV